MKTTLFRLPLVLAFLAFLIPAVPSKAAIENDDWSVGVLDQILAGVQPGQTFVKIDDMDILVTRLQAWRNELAGVPTPESAFSGDVSAAQWPNGNVFYSFSNNVPANFQKAFINAATDWTMFANLHFILRTTQANYILVQVNTNLGASEGGESFVGMVGGPQALSIAGNAWNRGTLCHEIGHALGLVHEHQRFDRDKFVTIVTNNIQSGDLSDFVLLSNSKTNGPYDFFSVMHYSKNAFATSPNLVTIQPLPAFSQFLNVEGIAGPVTLSAADRAGMASNYGAATVTVSSVVTNTQDTGVGSLRAALYFAFDHTGTHVTFNIPTNDPGFTNGIFTIQPTDELPWLVNATVLDGSTQPTNANFHLTGPSILINGAQCPVPSTFASGLQIGGTNFGGANCTARSLIINGFPASGIMIAGSNTFGNTVVGCYLGIDPTGSFAVTNDFYPLAIEEGAHGNTVGGIGASNRNILSGATFQGLFISDPGTTGNVVEGNYIGLNAAGTAAIPNGLVGVNFPGLSLANNASGNIIGGTAPGAGNVLSGNANQGVAIRDPGTVFNVIEGNLIGLNAAGTAAIPNVGSGVQIFLGAQLNIIGGTVSGARNVISGNGSTGVSIDEPGTTGNIVEGNYVGLNAAGTAAIPNVNAGAEIFDAAQSNLIGGTIAGAGNVISGNDQQGVLIGTPGTSGNLVEGNYVGLNPAGNAAIPNGFAGANLFDGATGNTIGGTAPGAGNVISGNSDQGVAIQDAGTASNFIQGNIIGLNAAGNAAISSAAPGVEIFDSAGPDNLIGGINSGGNVISGNGQDGVLLDSGASSNLVQGNFIGLDVTGITAIPNAGSGVDIFEGANGNFIGGIGGRNYIAGNSQNGVQIVDSAFGDIVQGNTIGLNIANAAVPNLITGVQFFGGAQSNIVGGTFPGAANLIANNGQSGVESFNAGTIDNSVRGNSIFGVAGGVNGPPGIYLNEDGANNNQAAPSLNSAALTTNTTITGQLSSAANTTYHIDFYASLPPSLPLQAKVYLGAKDVTTSSGGTVSFTEATSAIVPIGQFITATATDPSGNTSALSGSVAVTGTDSIGDGISDAWRIAHFGGNGKSTNSTSCATCDPDHDGLNNRQEFFAGTDPNNAASALRSGTAAPNGADVHVTFPTVQGIVYRVEYRDELAGGEWLLLADQIIGTGSNIEITDPGAASEPARFYRVDVLP